MYFATLFSILQETVSFTFVQFVFRSFLICTVYTQMLFEQGIIDNDLSEFRDEWWGPVRHTWALIDDLNSPGVLNILVMPSTIIYSAYVAYFIPSQCLLRSHN